jgi:hypothetical protein
VESRDAQMRLATPCWLGVGGGSADVAVSGSRNEGGVQRFCRALCGGAASRGGDGAEMAVGPGTIDGGASGTALFGAMFDRPASGYQEWDQQARQARGPIGEGAAIPTANHRNTDVARNPPNCDRPVTLRKGA